MITSKQQKRWVSLKKISDHDSLDLAGISDNGKNGSGMSQTLTLYKFLKSNKQIWHHYNLLSSH